jgi:hypothetical protein
MGLIRNLSIDFTPYNFICKNKMNLMKIKHVKIIVKRMSHDRFQRDRKDFSITEQRMEENRKSKNKIALKKYLSTIS